MADEYDASGPAGGGANAPAKKRRHRFQTVHERVQNLQRELQLTAKSSSAAGGHEELSFLDELRLQGELTTLDSFQLLGRKLLPLVATTPQLLHHLPKVIAAVRAEMERALQEAGGVTKTAQDVQRERLVPLLKLVTALARELRKEFYPHFAKTLPLIVAVIDTKDPELSTHAFKTLSMLFHYLRTQLLADMEAIHKCYFPLLGHSREFVREFAAQTLAVLLRRVDSIKQLRKYLGSYLRALTRGAGGDDEILLDGSAKLFFALVRNVNHGFHSRMRDIVLFLLGSFRPKDDHDGEIEKDAARAVVFSIVSKTCELMIRHTDAEHGGELLECLSLAVTKAASLVKADDDEAVSMASAMYLRRLISITWAFTRFRHGTLVLFDGDAKLTEARVATVHNVCNALMKNSYVILASPCFDLRGVMLNFFETVWRLFPGSHEDTFAQVKAYFSAAASASSAEDHCIESRNYWLSSLIEFSERALHHAYVKVFFIKEFLFPNAIEWAFESLLQPDERVGAFSTLICELAEYVKQHGSDAIDDNNYVVMSKGQCFLRTSSHSSNVDKRLLAVAKQVIHDGLTSVDEDSKASGAKLALAWKFCKALAVIRINDDSMIKFTQTLLSATKKTLASCTPGTFNSDANGKTAGLFGLQGELWRLQQIATFHHAASTKSDADFVNNSIEGKAGSHSSLSALLDVLRWKIGDTDNDPRRDMLSKSKLPQATELLLPNLRSPSHELRMVSLEIIAQFETLEYDDASDNDSPPSTLIGPCEMVEVCVALERASATISVETEREVIRLLTRVKILSRSPQTPGLYKQIAVNQLLGLFHVKFSTIWPHIAEAIEPIARSNFDATWKSISAELLAASWRQDPKPGTVELEGDEPIKASLLPFEKSLRQEYSAVCVLEQGRVDGSSSTDFITHHSLLWKALEKFIDLVEMKTRFVVPLFSIFLRDQYRMIYLDELDESRLAEVQDLVDKIAVKEKTGDLGDFLTSDGSHWLKPQHFEQLTTKSVRSKLIDFLKLFGAFRNLKGAYAQGFLHDFFFDLLVKSDEVISKLALQCLYGFDKKHLAAYKSQLDRITDSATFREELTNFDISEQGGAVLREHRPHLVPVLMRILYSKCISKKGRGTGDTVAARRAAILSYLAALEPAELQAFIELVVKAFKVKIELGAPIDTQITPLDISSVQPSRVMGFLNLLEDLIGQLGVKLTAFVPAIANVLVSILKQKGVGGAEEDGEDDQSATPMDIDETGDKEDPAKEDATSGLEKRSIPEYTAGMRKQTRMLTMRRFAELVDTFDTLVPLTPWVTDVLETVEDAVLRLPKSVVGADKASALLELLLAVARADRSREILPEAYVLSTISCLSAGLASNSSAPTGITPQMLEAVLQFMGSLLDGDEKPGRQSAKPFQLFPHIPFVLRQFVNRFQARAARYARDRYAGSARKEFTFLCRLSSHLEHYDSADEDAAAHSRAAAHDLFQLLLPFLQRSHRASDADKENILLVLAQIVPRLSEPAKHVLALTKLLAPGPNSVSERQARSKLVDVFAALGRHPDSKELSHVAEMLAALNAYDAKRVEDVDFERRMDALNQINASKFGALTRDSHLLAPILAQYLTCMHDPEYSIRSGALVGLSEFVELAAAQTSGEVESLSAVLNTLESLVMPSVRFSLRSSSEDVRRGFVSLLGHIADFAKPGSAFRSLPYVHGDLAMLRNREDPEADFFYNITHIQAHRKRRALQRLGTLMAQMGERQQMTTIATAAETEGEWFSNSTVNNILLPLLLHFVYEAQAKAQESIRSEAASCIGRAAGLLRWSHYLSLLRRLLKSIDGHADAENTIISTVCEVIDHFHFAAPGAATEWQSKEARKAAEATAKKNLTTDTDIAMEDADDDEEMDNDKEDDGVDIESSKVQDTMEAQVLPMLKKYLFKGVTAKGVAKTGRESGNNLSLDSDAVVSQAVRVRVPLALAVVKVLRRLRAETFFLELPKLLLSFTKLLKSKDEAVRTSARLTLVNITQELGLTYLLPIVDELRHTLREGYMVHVLSYTLHSILEKVSTMVEHSKPASLLEKNATNPGDIATASPLDLCIPVMMEILVEELFFDAIENQDGSAPHKSKMKEAKASGSRGYDSLELLARSMAFLPNPSIHGVLSALVSKYRALEAGYGGVGSSASKALTILRDALKRVALGLTKNPAVERSYVCLFAYNLMTSCLETVRPATEQERAKYQQAGLVTSWLVNEKSAEATRALATSSRVRATDTAKVLAVPSRMTGYDRHNIGGALNDEEDDSKPVSTVHLDELLTFAVLLIHSTMKRSPTAATQTTTSQRLPSVLVDPLVPLLMRCAAEAKNDRAVIQSLKCLTQLLARDDLSAIDVALDPLVRRLFKIMQKAGASTRNEMVQTCYRALTAVLTARPSFRMTEAQLRVALSFVRADLDEREHQNATYALLRAVISSRLVVNEVYDVVLRVGELLVQSDAQSARSNCRAIYVTFLLEYPLGPKRVAQHLNFLMNNLGYTYESGRAAVLDALCVLLRKLPAEIVNERAQFFLLPLVLRLANDDAAACRSLASDAITSLLRRMGAQELNECIQLIVKWWNVEPASSEEGKSKQRPGHEQQKALPTIADPKLLCAAAQVTTLALRARPESLARKPQDGNKKRGTSGSNGIVVLDNAARALVRSLADVESADDSSEVAWQVAYYVVECLVAWSEHLPGVWETWLALSEGKKPSMRTTFLDKVVLRLLEYPHAWVRLSTMRLLNSYLKRRSAKTLQLLSPEQLVKSHMDRGVTKNGDGFLKQPGMLFLIASSVSKLLDRNGAVLDEEMSNEVLATLPFMLEALVSLPDIPQHVSEDVSVMSDEEEEEEESVSEQDGDDTMEIAEEEAEPKPAEESGSSKPTTPVGWLLTRLSYVSRAAHSSVQIAIFKLFAALITTRDVEFVRQYVTQMINPLYRVSTSSEATKAALVSESSSGNPSTSALPQSESALLAHEVLSLLEQKLGGTEFLEAYTFVQRKVATFRATRKQQRKREFVNDPARAAARKLQKNEQKRRSKQLKKRKYAVLKGTVSAATRPRKVMRPGAE